ncbi:MAG: Gfo/Idh/MocA family oxidoreductase [Ignavibacteriales bacterium]|nr:Gfo/Idh/MocA family oxidoreductase [Ignavibacteriales bacterium]
MLEEAKPEAVVVSVPTKYHASMVQELLEKGIHVFTEKPFCLSPEQGAPLVELARKKD